MVQSARTNSLWSRITATFGHWPGIGTVLIAAALLRLASIPLVRSYLHPETWEFGPLARNLAQGFGYTDLLKDGSRVPSIFMPPAYSYFLAFFFWLGGERPATYLAIEVLQAAFGVLLVYVVYRLARLLIGERGAIAAACMTAIFPTQIYMCNEFHGISIYIVLETAAVFFLIRYLQISHAWGDVILAGLCMGVLLPFRGEAPALVLVYAAILALRGGRKAVVPAVAFALIAAACLAPWTIRNYREFGRVIPVCASGGYNLCVGNNENATGSQHYNYIGLMPAGEKAELGRIPLGRNTRVAQDDFLKRLAVDYIRTHPREEAVLALKKLFIFFVFDPSHEKGRNPAYWIPSLLLSLLAIWGAILRGKKLFGNDLFLVGSILLAVAVGMVVFVLPRYKIVIDPFLIIIAANVFAAKAPLNKLSSEAKPA